MPGPDAAPENTSVATRPAFGYGPLFIGLRYLLKKKLSYLAIVGITLSVAVIIVVMSVFTGFHREFTSIIRGYLSDIKVRPRGGGMYAMRNWELWRRKVLALDHVTGAAPFIEGAGLLRQSGTGRMLHVMFRGVHPELEGTASELPEYMVTGQMEDLRRSHPNPDGGSSRACFVGHEFFGFIPPELQSHPPRIVLVTATEDLRYAMGTYAVNGVFKTGNAEYDSRFVILSLRSAANLVECGEAVSGLNVRLDDYENAAEVVPEISDAVRPGSVLHEFGRTAEGAPAALSADALRLALAADDGSVSVRSTLDAEEVSRAGPYDTSPAALALDPEGSNLLVGFRDGTARLVRLGSESAAVQLGSPGAPVTAAAFSPFGYLVAVAHEDGRVEVWDVEAPAEPVARLAHGAEITDVAFDSGGERLLTAGRDGKALLWSAEEGRLIGRIRDEGNVPMTRGAFSPDGDWIATGHADGRIVLWDASALGPQSAWEAHGGPVRALRFGWTSEVLLSAGRDAITCWRVGRRARRAGIWKHFEAAAPAGGFRRVLFGGEGRRAATVGPEGKVHLRYSGGGLGVTTWKQERKTFLEAVEMERFLQGLIMSLILVLAEFFIFVIITTMVYEKRRDIGILKAVGYTPGQICLVFLTCGLAIGLIGAALGVGGGVLFAENINAVRDFVRETIHFDPFPPNVYYFTEIPAYVGFLTPAITAGGAVICSLLFSLVPAIRAAGMDPVETLRYE